MQCLRTVGLGDLLEIAIFSDEPDRASGPCRSGGVNPIPVLVDPLRTVPCFHVIEKLTQHQVGRSHRRDLLGGQAPRFLVSINGYGDPVIFDRHWNPNIVREPLHADRKWMEMTARCFIGAQASDEL